MTELKRIQILRAVALEADLFYEQAQEIGNKSAANLTKNKRAQITGLEAIANSALKISDVFDYIKIRTARQSEWRQWGPDLLIILSEDLKNKKKNICDRLTLGYDSPEAQEIYLLLTREFVHQLAANYEYACVVRGNEVR